MRKVMFESLYIINTAWNADDMLNIFFSDGRPSWRMAAKDAAETYGTMEVVFVNGYTVELS